LRKLYPAIFLLVLLFGVMIANFYFLHRELKDFYSLVVKEEVEKVRSVVEGTLSAGGDPVEALSYYIEHSKLLKGATFYLEGREIVVPGSDISSSYYQVVLEVKPFKFKLFIDTSYLEELNRHIKIIFFTLIFFTLIFVGALFYSFREYYRERLELERERQEKERFKSINLVIHSILHEVKNRLNVLNLLIHRFERKGELSYIERLKGELSALNRYVEETSDLRRPLKLEVSTFKAGQLLKEAKERVLPLFESKRVEFHLSYDDCTLKADYQRLLSALTDFLKNAVEALEGKEKKVVRLEGKRKGYFYLFRVLDSGGALPRGEELFKPFKTSKEKGFGLGLFNVKRVALAHGGSVKAYADKGWTVFELSIPTDCSENSPREG
jgi:signal transduction histidine kinase